ncbi:MAG: hypothetical protein H7Z15_11300 [Rhizobacter sp.]|nr:hypothetical protein [Rhizobacter sp.]
MPEKIFAIAVLAICVVMMVRLLLGVRLRMKVDAVALRAWQGIRGGSRSLFHRRQSSPKSPAQVAEEVIQRAREGGTWEGNVYKPKSFDKTPPRDKLH